MIVPHGLVGLLSDWVAEAVEPHVHTRRGKIVVTTIFLLVVAAVVLWFLQHLYCEGKGYGCLISEFWGSR